MKKTREEMNASGFRRMPKNSEETLSRPMQTGE
jgi:hypothetical protein